MLCQTSAFLQLELTQTNKYFTYPDFCICPQIISISERGFSNPGNLYGSEFLEFAVFLNIPSKMII